MSDKIKVILDSDIGTDIDDALAIAYLLQQPKCELMGVTTLTGEAEKRAMLASTILHAAGRDDIPIYPGTEKCILIEQREKYCAHAEALEKWEHRTDFPKNQALQFMQKTIRENPGEVVLLGISPMSNISRLFLMDPELPGLLKGIYLMCGRFTEYDRDNWLDYINVPEKDTAFAPDSIMNILSGGTLEMNACIDPYATAIMYKESTAAPVHRSIGYDMTHRVCLSMDDFIARCKHPLFRPILDQAGVWFKTRDYVMFHDPLAVVCAFDDSVCKFTRGTVDIELGNNKLRGYTYFTPHAEGKHEVATSVDEEAFFNAYFSVFEN